MSQPERYESLILGSGAGGKLLAWHLANSGRRTAVVERKDFVRRERHSTLLGDTQYAFQHVLLRDVAYGQIPRRARAEKHRRAGDWIEGLARPEDNAGHRWRSSSPVPFIYHNGDDDRPLRQQGRRRRGLRP